MGDVALEQARQLMRRRYAPPASNLANAEATADSGFTSDEVQRIMIAVAPIVGTARVVSAGGKILRD